MIKRALAGVGSPIKGITLAGVKVETGQAIGGGQGDKVSRKGQKKV